LTTFGDVAPVAKLLIANRGEIARRIQRTCRDLGIRTVAIYSDVDADAPFVHEADEAVSLGGRSPAESYLRIDAIIDAALLTGADSIHPGYGFLAENAEFARACARAGVRFLGPDPETIDAMGSKVQARALMEAADVPVAPAVTLESGAEHDAAALIERVGLPAMIKASAGGGGKGMRIVRAADELEAGLRAARSEALSAFGDDTVFVERYVERARHIEVQIIGDHHGDVRHLFERECSIQRRHQKVVEEAPSVVMNEDLRHRFTSVAIDAGRALGYRSVGTVEFLYAQDTDEIFFLEINTRLQVEHPVTEQVTGLDLVRAQIEIAEGATLDAVIGEPVLTGHAVEVRLYAEDAARGFLPATGVLSCFDIPARPGLRVEAGPVSGDAISADYDPMIAKVIATAATRPAALRLLAGALRDAKLHGLTTNRDFLVRLLEDEDFARGEFDTQFLDRPEAQELGRPLVESEADLQGYLVAAALAAQAAERGRAPLGRSLPSGWRNNPGAGQRRAYRRGEVEHEVVYDIGRSVFSVDGADLPECAVVAATPTGVVLVTGGRRRSFTVSVDRGLVAVNGPTGQLDLEELSRFGDGTEERVAGSLAAPVPGRVVRVACAAGNEVEAGQVVLVIEAMKMQHEVVAPHGGSVEQLLVAEGDQLDAGAVVAVIVEPNSEEPEDG
jgi:acetyl/propionyl-CoA carboxylase alpha subunit